MVNKRGDTALSLFAAMGHASVVEKLLEYEELCVNVTDTDGQTALMKAAAAGHLSIVEQLLQRPELSCTEKDNAGETALSLAIKGEHSTTAELLRRHIGGEDPQSEDSVGEGHIP